MIVKGEKIMYDDLRDKRVVVTGGASESGYATAVRYYTQLKPHTKGVKANVSFWLWI